MARAALPESKIRARRKRRRFIVLFLLALTAVLVCALLVWFAQSPIVRISHIEVKGAETVATSTIVAHIEEQLDGSYAYLFPKDTIFLYPKKAIVRSLLQELSVLASVNISADTFQRITVTVVERKPKALWCGADAANPIPCFLLDEEGVAYGAALTFSGNAYVKYYGQLTGSTTPKRFITATKFRSLSALVDTIAANQKNDQVVSVWVDQYEDVHMTFASGFVLYFALSVDGGDLYQRFTLALQSDPFKAHKIGDFEYLDLRFGDKLYYKLK